MLHREEIIKYLKESKEDFREKFKFTKLGLFGSFANGTATETSDIALIVEFEPNTENLREKKNAIKREVGQNFIRQIDLCREKFIKPYFKEYIVESAIYV